MRYLPHTTEDIKEMLQVVGVDSLDELFPTIPDAIKLKEDLDLPEALTEWELNDHMDDLSAKMAVSPEYKVFMGAGSYDHFIPASVSYLLGRSEFSTAYTPYQPEISQGTLQGIYEFQTLITRLLGMDVATASHYDGATALSEACLVAINKTRKNRVAISSLIHPLQRKVIETYLKPTGHEIVEIPYTKDGKTDLSALDGMEDIAGVAIQSPNFFGCIEDLEEAGAKAHGMGALFITSFTEALSYGLLKKPGSFGADLAVGDGQSFGIPKSFGGPGLGILTASKKLMRAIPGRLVGRAKDADGKDGFVLTLSTREQHIRREKASSNICSNNGLCAMTAAMYMASVGNTGIRELAKLNHDKAEYLKKALAGAGLEIPFSTPTFNEFVVKIPGGKEVYSKLLEKKIVAGVPLEKYYPELEDHYLLCVTETMSREDMDKLVREVK